MHANLAMTRQRALTALFFVASFTLALGVAAEAAVVQGENASPSYTAGIVLAVDVPHGRLSLEQAGYEDVTMNMVIESDTKLQKKGESLRLSDIHVGDPVSIEYEIGPRNRKLARSVEVLTIPASSGR